MRNSIRQTLIKKFITFSRNFKITIAIMLDTSICIIATWLALSLRLDKFVYFDFLFSIPLLISICTAIPIFYFMGLYKVIFRYISGDTIKVLAKAIAIYTLIYSVIFVLIVLEEVFRYHLL